VRFLAAYAASEGAWNAKVARIFDAARSLGVNPSLEGPRFKIAIAGDEPIVPIAGRRGLVLGALFQRTGPLDAVETLDAGVSDRIVRTAGQSLIDDFWGGYLAFVLEADGAGVHVLRDPSGGTPCFHLRQGGVTYLVSDVALAFDLGLVDGSLDWSFVAHHLAFPGLRTARTGLVGVSELIAGARLTLAPIGETEACCWTPWTFAHPDRRRHDQGEAVERLRAETRRCVGAWASRSRSILLELSGGLDSSIVAACLEAALAPVHCLTVTTPHLGADERAYARRVAEQIGRPWTVVPLDAAAADLTAAWPTRLARPGLNVLQRALDHAVVDVARQVDADAIFSGAGGDSVFCYLDTAAPAADALLAFGPGRRFAGAVADLARLHQCTVWRAGGLALRKALKPAPKVWRGDPSFLSQAAASTPPQSHPWFPGPAGALPGAREQVASIMGLQSTSEGNGRSSVGAVRHPLLSQPLVELCLSLPSWMWIAGGRNRAIAREAFAGSLPAAILSRKTKGDFTGFDAEVFERQRGVLRERLLDGALAAQGLIDRPAVERFLAAPLRPRDSRFFRLFVAADVETWIESWAAGPSRAAGLRRGDLGGA